MQATRGLAAVAFFHSSAEAIRGHAGRRAYAFSLVPDPDQEIYRNYSDWIRSMRHGFWGGADAQMAKIPADFLVGPDGRILLVHYGHDIGDHLSLAEIERALADV